jgi:hypothetical protein
MPKRDDDLFTRLRRAGVRKPVAKTLSELTGDAGKKAAGAGHLAVAELRALADEIEKRLPTLAVVAAPPAPPAPVTAATTPRKRPAARRSAAKQPAAAPRATAAKPATSARASAAKPAAGARTAAAKPAAGARAAAAKPAAGASAAKPAARGRGTAAKPAASAATAAPRGENKTKILQALKAGPHTASEISQTTGIATATVSAALTRLSRAGDVTKAARGYALPS